MIDRHFLAELQIWKTNPNRKPLIIRGARQVGKTTVVHQFARDFDQYLYLNLERKEDRELFQKQMSLPDLIQYIFFVKNQVQNPQNETLLFIDEIQEEPSAISTLRYFLEEAPQLYVIAAGSLLETLFKGNIRIPVGRVEFKMIRPVSFPEFLQAIGEEAALNQLNTIPLSDFAHEKLLRLFHSYALIGGMPEIVNQYAEHRDLASLSPIYESLINSYLDDVEKYADRPSQVQVIRHAIKTSYVEAGNRIRFHGFGRSNYQSREMGEALRTIEKALLIQLIYPHTSTQLPLLPELKKSPRLQVLDTGLMNYFVGIQREILNSEQLHSVYQGKMLEHLVGQEILASQYLPLSQLHFWVREKKSSTAEVDFVYSWESKLIPIEVKAGKTGRLKSLTMYMDRAPHQMAVRMFAGKLSIDTIHISSEKSYYLLNLPYYLGSKIDMYLDWFQENISKQS